MTDLSKVWSYRQRSKCRGEIKFKALGWDWARAGPGSSRFKQKCANFFSKSKPLPARDLHIFSTARIFETQDFYNGFIVIQVETLTWRAPNWLSEPRDATNIWECTVHTVKVSWALMPSLFSTTKHFIELWFKCYIPLPQSHFLKNRIRFLWHFGTLSNNKHLKLTSQSCVLEEIIRTNEYVFGLIAFVLLLDKLVMCYLILTSPSFGPSLIVQYIHTKYIL